MKLFLSLFFAFSATNVSADCWVANNIKGYSAYSQDQYTFEENDLLDGNVHIEIKDDQASVKQLSNSSFGEGMKFISVNKNAMMGSGTFMGMTIIENWAITEENKVLFSRIRLDKDSPEMTSVTSFVGDIIGKC